jgi:SNF family Na+-dependent transporter
VEGGGIQAAGTETALKTGAHLVVGGLFVQLVFFGCFIAVAVHFDVAMHKVPTLRAQSEVPWRKHLVVLYAASVLIMIRSIFRVVEYLQGFSGYLLSHEVYLYMFDSVLMLCVMIIFNTVHPSEVVALVNGGRAVKKGWKMERIVGYQDTISSDNLRGGVA